MTVLSDLLSGIAAGSVEVVDNLDRLPVTGVVLIASPLPIVGGSGSPARVLALVAR